MQQIKDALVRAGYSDDLVEVILDERSAHIASEISRLELAISRVLVEMFVFAPIDQTGSRCEKITGGFLVNHEIGKIQEIELHNKRLNLLRSLLSE